MCIRDSPKTAKVIVCHLGNGASISASVGGKCVDCLLYTSDWLP